MSNALREILPQQGVSKIWFAEDGGQFNGDEPNYFDTADFPWVAEIEANWKTIHAELLALLQEEAGALSPYANREMTSRPDQWKTFGMMFWMHTMDENCRKCPKTWALLRRIPDICGASFNLLEPHTTIKPHHGDTNAIIRCHLGLEIPALAPKCGFRVGNETRSWQEGKFLMFCDAHVHTAWNNTDHRRYIMVVDIMRPEYVHRRKSVSARVLASIQMAIYYQRHAWLKRYFSGATGKRLLFGAIRATVGASLLFKRGVQTA